mmetsp:Transcript_3294/g.10908  ORF Transcript_3294/g.10908 Transcript_3294/m.10908 type:complete len:284 (-) Transcript_3294:41-892(-)
MPAGPRWARTEAGLPGPGGGLCAYGNWRDKLTLVCLLPLGVFCVIAAAMGAPGEPLEAVTRLYPGVGREAAARAVRTYLEGFESLEVRSRVWTWGDGYDVVVGGANRSVVAVVDSSPLDLADRRLTIRAPVWGLPLGSLRRRLLSLLSAYEFQGSPPDERTYMTMDSPLELRFLTRRVLSDAQGARVATLEQQWGWLRATYTIRGPAPPPAGPGQEGDPPRGQPLYHVRQTLCPVRQVFTVARAPGAPRGGPVGFPEALLVVAAIARERRSQGSGLGRRRGGK